MADIFLSYAREDETRARALAAALGSRGWSVFWDRRIPHGRDFRTHIQQQLDSARCIVVLWSKASVTSQFVLDEAEEGKTHGRLVPAFIEAVRQPLGFRGLQAANLTDWTAPGASHDEFDRLVDSIEAIVPRLQTAAAVEFAAELDAAAPAPAVHMPPGTKAATHQSQPVAAPLNTEAVARSGRSSGTQAVVPNISDATERRQPFRTLFERLKQWMLADPFRRIKRPAVLVLVTVLVTIGAIGISFWRNTANEPSTNKPVVPPTSGQTTAPPSGTSAPAKRGGPQAGEVRTGPSTGVPPPGDVNLSRDEAWMPAFIEIPAGPFTMGSDKNKDSQASDNELPQHQVTLSAFFIGRDEVTVGRFKVCAKEGGCKPSDGISRTGPDDLPVRNVSWHEAIAYCAWLETKLKASRATPADLADALAGRRGGGEWHVTLPSEGEWEKAARGTDGRLYPWGDRVDPTKANYRVNKFGGHTAVGSFPGGDSPYGVRDMSGNVAEWTRSHYRPYPYRPDDGRENLTAGDVVFRVLRGGSFWGGSVRAAARDWVIQSRSNDDIGFRVVVSPFQP